MQKDFQIWTFITQLLTTYQIFTKLPHIKKKKHNFVKYNWKKKSTFSFVFVVSR